jgi:hypothetical protein
LRLKEKLRLQGKGVRPEGSDLKLINNARARVIKFSNREKYSRAKIRIARKTSQQADVTSSEIIRFHLQRRRQHQAENMTSHSEIKVIWEFSAGPTAPFDERDYVREQYMENFGGIK